MKTRLITLVFLIFAAALTRLLPHPWNFTAIGAIALFGGSHFSSRWQSMLVPMVALLLTDLILGLYTGMIYTYGAFALIVILGWTLTEKASAFRIGTCSLVASTLFFVISNLGVWALDALYPRTFAGLADCYVMAIPFFGNQILGDLFYSGVIFGAYALLKRSVPALSADLSASSSEFPKYR
jgi:hypothetical protein